ncbi:hypothetical protein V6Z11_A08G177400 [Gossypium hirsutum]
MASVLDLFFFPERDEPLAFFENVSSEVPISDSADEILNFLEGCSSHELDNLLEEEFISAPSPSANNVESEEGVFNCFSSDISLLCSLKDALLSPFSVACTELADSPNRFSPEEPLSSISNLVIETSGQPFLVAWLIFRDLLNCGSMESLELRS